MNNDEKKALRNFLFIYVTSTIFLVSVILYIYYENELRMSRETCTMELKNASMQVKADIIDKYMKKKDFIPEKLKKENIKYALLDKDKKIIFSYLDDTFPIDYSKDFYENSHYNYFITILDEENIPIKYIVMETCQVVQNKSNIKLLLLIKLIISSIFIACIGYLLSKILLNPARKRVDSMDKFIKDSAHELNTPISVLMTSVSMLKNGKNPQKMMKYILSSSKQISQIYNDIHFSAFNEMNEDVFEEFNLNNDKGVVNYLINESSVDEITNATEISFLDVILSGPIPPNPAELIISERLGDLMRELKQKYDYIILDTPPVGLVSDALELDQYCDVTLYIVRQNFSKKDMITLLNNRVKRGELKNTSIVLNGFENKAKYGTGYGYGYGYGYGNNTYAEGYHEKEPVVSTISKVVKWLKKERKL